MHAMVNLLFRSLPFMGLYILMHKNSNQEQQNYLSESSYCLGNKWKNI